MCIFFLDTSACVVHAGNTPHSSNECQQGLDFTCIDQSHPMENGKGVVMMAHDFELLSSKEDLLIY